MDVLVYSNIKDVYVNTDYALARVVLADLTSENEKVRWVCRFDTLHTGELLADAFGLDKNILGECSTYTDICNNPNAITEITKIPKLLSAFADDFNQDLDILDILQNKKTEALGYLQDGFFLERVCRIPEAIRLLVKSQDYCNVVYSTISNHRMTLVNTLKNYSYNISKGTVNVGNGNTTSNWGQNAPYIAIPISCYDDKSDTDFSIYSYNNNHRVTYIPKHFGSITVNQGVCLRGCKVVGSGASIGYATFDYYYLP